MRTIFIAGSQKSEKGNFTVTTGSGDTFFLHSKKAEGKGELIGQWATIVEKTYNKLGTDGKQTGETFSRFEVAALFPNKEVAMQATTAEAIFQVEAAALVQTAATTAGLSQTAIDALLAASI